MSKNKKIAIKKVNEKQTQAVGSTLSPQWSRHSVDTRRRATAPAFVYLTKRVFSRLGETKILLESPSSNLRELEIPN